MKQGFEFTIRKVRCFDEEQSFRIRPLTFLVGENSTGKTTALGSLFAVSQLASYPFLFRRDAQDFNAAPYFMGSFRDISRRTRQFAKSFQLGVKLENEGKPITFRYTFDEKDNGSEPEILDAEWTVDGTKFFIGRNHESFNNRQKKLKKILLSEHFIMYFPPESLDEFYFFPRLVDADSWPWHLFAFLDIVGWSSSNNSELTPDEKRILKKAEKLASQTIDALYQVDAFGDIENIAPIRSKPQRTYNPLKASPTADGTEMPHLLRNLRRGEKAQWERLRKELLLFGKKSNLFSDISVRQLGKSSGDPFQLQLAVRGPKSNIMDVGYGVSQIMPILTRVLMGKRIKMYLMQQPEVHLHPKAQASLLSFLVSQLYQPQNQDEKTVICDGNAQ